MSNDRSLCPTSAVGLSRLRESRSLGAIGQQGKSWSVTEASKDGFSGFFYSLVRRGTAEGRYSDKPALA